MKNLQKLVVLLVMTVFIFSSCSNVKTTSELGIVGEDQLVDQLANNENFAEIVKIRSIIETDLSDFYNNNLEAIRIDPTIMENFIFSYDNFEKELGNYSTMLTNEIPAFLTLSQDSKTTVLYNASHKLSTLENNISLRECSCRDCFSWLNDTDYAAYISQNQNECLDCGGCWDECNAENYQWFLSAYQSNLAWYYDCRAGRDQCDFIPGC